MPDEGSIRRPSPVRQHYTRSVTTLRDHRSTRSSQPFSNRICPPSSPLCVSDCTSTTRCRVVGRRATVHPPSAFVRRNESLVDVHPTAGVVLPDVERPFAVVHPLVAEEGVVPPDVVLPVRVYEVAHHARVRAQVLVSTKASASAEEMLFFRVPRANERQMRP